MPTTQQGITQKNHLIAVFNKIESLKVLRDKMHKDMYLNNNVRDSKTKQELYLISQAIYQLDLLTTSLMSN